MGVLLIELYQQKTAKTNKICLPIPTLKNLSFLSNANFSKLILFKINFSTLSLKKKH